MSKIDYIIDYKPQAEDDKIIRNGIVAFNSAIIKEQATHFSIFAKDNDTIVGGALIWQHSDALYIDVIWVDEYYRKKGMGTKLISLIEGAALDKGLTKIFVDTYDFQAQEFYNQHDFYSIGTIAEYLLGHDRIFMRKDLINAQHIPQKK